MVQLDASIRDLRPERPVPPRDQPQQPLKRLLELGAPDVIIRNEKPHAPEAVDSLIDIHSAQALSAARSL